jgi:cell division protein FtsB
MIIFSTNGGKAMKFAWPILFLLVLPAAFALTDEQWEGEKQLLMDQVSDQQKIIGEKDRKIAKLESEVDNLTQEMEDGTSENYKAKYEYYRGRASEYEGPAKRWLAWDAFCVGEFGKSAEEYWREFKEPSWWHSTFAEKWLFWLYFVTGSILAGIGVRVYMERTRPEVVRAWEKKAKKVVPSLEKRIKKLEGERYTLLRQDPVWTVKPEIMEPGISTAFKKLVKLERGADGVEEIVPEGRKFGDLVWIDSILRMDPMEFRREGKYLLLFRELGRNPMSGEGYYELMRHFAVHVKRLSRHAGTRGEMKKWAEWLAFLEENPRKIMADYESQAIKRDRSGGIDVVKAEE